jgi:hypothetical protein
VGSTAGLDAVARRKNLCPCWQLNPASPARRIVTILTDLSRIPTFFYWSIGLPDLRAQDFGNFAALKSCVFFLHISENIPSTDHQLLQRK